MKKILVVLLLFVASLQAEIHEIKNMDELHSYLKPDMLIVFDIDNTLMEPVQELGSDQWFYHRIKEYEAWGKSKQEALEKALKQWTSIQNVTKVRLCEAGTDEIVQNLQRQGFTIMGLTTRGLGMSELTIQQLGLIHVNLSPTAPTQEEIHFMNERGCLFRTGILFTAATHKGEAMRKLFDKIDWWPKSILFINDKQTHIAEFEETMIQHGVPFIGLRYGATDERVLNFRNHLAEVQYSFFGHILTDEQAERILHETNDLPSVQ